MNRQHIAWALLGIGIVLFILGVTGVVANAIGMSGIVCLVVGKIIWRSSSPPDKPAAQQSENVSGMTRRTKVTGYGIIILWMILPMIPVFIASVIASHCGCKLDEGSAHSCILFGKDIGGALYQMGMIGWVGMITFPTGLIALLVFTRAVMTQNRAVSPAARPVR